MGTKKKKTAENVICDNRKARHDYHILDSFQAGIVLDGWEVKSLRAGRAQLSDSYVRFKNSEAWLIGAHFSVLNTICQHTKPDPIRSRKLLLNRKEINHLAGRVAQKGETVIPLNLHWSRGRVKLSIGLAKGKKLHDKRESLKEKALKLDSDRRGRRG